MPVDDSETPATTTSGAPAVPATDLGPVARARRRFSLPAEAAPGPAAEAAPGAAAPAPPAAGAPGAAPAPPASGGPTPPGPSGGPPPGPDAGADRPSTERYVRLPVAVLIGAVLLIAGLVLGQLVRTPGPGAAAAPSHPTELGQVVRVLDGRTVSVRVGDRTFETVILGIDVPVQVPGGPPACGSRAATDLAARTLTGQTVTLVPDPTVPESDGQGRRLAYVVLRTQANYTDRAILAGVARAESDRVLWYHDVFAGEQADARSRGVGLWGPPCSITG